MIAQNLTSQNRLPNRLTNLWLVRQWRPFLSNIVSVENGFMSNLVAIDPTDKKCSSPNFSAKRIWKISPELHFWLEDLSASRKRFDRPRLVGMAQLEAKLLTDKVLSGFFGGSLRRLPLFSNRNEAFGEYELSNTLRVPLRIAFRKEEYGKEKGKTFP